MVAHLSSTYHINFTQYDATVPDSNHTHPLNIEVVVKQVMINNSSALNLCTLIFITQVGYVITDMHNQCITIKAYDDVERSLVGMRNLPPQVGQVPQSMLCHVVDLDLPWNSLLGHPWIHAMQAIPSTYH